MICKLVNVSTPANKPRRAADICNLPQHFIEKYELSLGTMVVIHIQNDSSPSDGDNDVQSNCLSYYKWSGHVSRHFPDCIEVQSSEMELETIRMVQASIVHPVPKTAAEVHVTPSTLYDWEILSNQADVVERQVLNQFNLVSIDQEMKFRVSDSLYVKVQTQKIVLEGEVELSQQTTKSHRADLSGDDIQPSSPLETSSSPFTLPSSIFSNLVVSPLKTIVGAIIDDMASDRNHPPVASLSTDTLVIIAPYENKISSVRRDSMDNDSRSGHESANIEKVLSSFLTLCSEVLNLQCLYVLPEKQRYIYTNTFIDETNVCTTVECTHLEDDGFTCLINPSQAEIARYLYSRASKNIFSEEGWNDVQESYEMSIITDLFKNGGTGLNNLFESKFWVLRSFDPTNQLQDNKQEKHRVKLRFTFQIPPFHVLIPYNIYKKLSKEDNQECCVVHISLDDDINRSRIEREDSVELPYLSKPLLESEDLHMKNFVDTEDIRSVISAIYMDIATFFHPQIIMKRAVSNVMPSSGCGLLIVGPGGCGKSKIIETSLFMVKSCPNIQIDIEVIDCSEWKGASGVIGATAMDKLARILERHDQSMCERSDNGTKDKRNDDIDRGTLIVLDNLDELCPAISDQETFVKDPQLAINTGLVAQKIETLLYHCTITNKRAHDRAVKLYSKHTRAQFSHLAGLDEKLDLSAGVKDLVVSASKNGVVFVIASCKSLNSLHHRLMTPFNIRKIIEIPELDAYGRYEFLTSRLTQLGFPLRSETTHGQTALSPEIRIIGTLTEGLKPRELINLACRVVVAASRRHFEQMAIDSNDDRLYSLLDEIQDAYYDQYPELGMNGSRGNKNSDNEMAWDAICGLVVAKRQILSVLRNPVVYRRLYKLLPIKMSRAVLLFGPPGNGKTVLARATASKCGLAFLSVKGPELLNKYIGASEKAVRDIFQKAKALGRPSIIFFDEFEAIAGKRGKDNSGVTDRVVNQLLTFLDGVEETMTDSKNSGSQVYIIAATSRPDLIDPALLRPGRVETHVYVGPPENAEEREELLRRNLMSCIAKNGSNSDDVDTLENTVSIIKKISSHKHAIKLTAADLKSVITSAYLEAVNEFVVKESSFSEAMTKFDTNNSSYNYNDDTIKNTLRVTDKHLWEAFLSTRPSISEEEMEFYESINMPFQKKNGRNRK